MRHDTNTVPDAITRLADQLRAARAVTARSSTTTTTTGSTMTG
jgi:hypothetical protein